MLVFRAVAAGLAGLFAATLFAQQAASPPITRHTPVAQTRSATFFTHAQPLPLPRPPVGAGGQEAMARAILAKVPQAVAKPGVSPGFAGSGQKQAAFLGEPVAPAQAAVAPQDYGSAGSPFSTARADLSNGSAAAATNTLYPYRAAGKLFFTINGQSYICSASMVKRGIVVTAAHCVAGFGTSAFYSNIVFVPGYRNGVAPYGAWPAANVHLVSSYLNGTDSCTVAGVVCENDIAVITLAPKNGYYPGTRTGWFGYAWGGYSFSNNTTHITQLGYPGCLDGAQYMQRNDAQAFVDATLSNNSVMGSLMCGGSSGGPWLANFGIPPNLTGTVFGSEPLANVVVGVTSWGYISNAVKEMGASPFISGNIEALVNAACAATPAACS